MTRDDEKLDSVILNYHDSWLRGNPLSSKPEKKSNTMYIAIAVIAIIVIAAVAGVYLYQPTAPTPTTTTIKIAFITTAPAEEAWSGVIHKAIQHAVEVYGADKLEYKWTENVQYADVPRIMREYGTNNFNVVIVDAFGCDDTARAAAKDYPNTYFVLGTDNHVFGDNVAVFDDWIHEPAYIAGMMAGKLTKTNTVGVVGGVAVPEVNRLINAFKAGAKATNPDVKVKVAFIGVWFDPPKAKEAAISQIDAGADVLYGERQGVIEACKERGIPVFGNLQDQWELAPDVVLTGPVWDMWPTVKHVVDMVLEKKWVAEDLRFYSMMQKGGALLAPWHDWETRLRPDIVQRMKDTGAVALAEDTANKIDSGAIAPIIDESEPMSD